jgi:hypothetical protein
MTNARPQLFAGRVCRRKRRPGSGSIARPGLGRVWERQADPGRGSHRATHPHRKCLLPQLRRYTELRCTFLPNRSGTASALALCSQLMDCVSPRQRSDQTMRPPSSQGAKCIVTFIN